MNWTLTLDELEMVLKDQCVGDDKYERQERKYCG